MRHMMLGVTLAAGMLAAGCSMTTATAGTECLAWQPITWSRTDTPQTIDEVKQSNARRRAWCEQKKTPGR